MTQKLALLFTALIFTLSTTASFAANSEYDPPVGTLQESSPGMYAFKRGTAIVFFSAVGGAILGLSTLSFYGEPREHTGNITAGAAIGLLAGAGYLFWESAQTKSNQPQWSLGVAPAGLIGQFRF